MAASMARSLALPWLLITTPCKPRKLAPLCLDGSISFSNRPIIGLARQPTYRPYKPLLDACYSNSTSSPAPPSPAFSGNFTRTPHHTTPNPTTPHHTTPHRTAPVSYTHLTLTPSALEYISVADVPIPKKTKQADVPHIHVNKASEKTQITVKYDR